MQSPMRICTLVISLTVTFVANQGYVAAGQLDAFMTISPAMETVVNQLSASTIKEITPHADALVEIVRDNELSSFFNRFSELCHKYPGNAAASTTDVPSSQPVAQNSEVKNEESPKSESIPQKSSEGEVQSNQQKGSEGEPQPNQQKGSEAEGRENQTRQESGAVGKESQAAETQEANKNPQPSESEGESASATSPNDGQKQKSVKTVNGLEENKPAKYRLNSAKAQITLLKKNGNVEATVVRRGAKTIQKSFSLSEVGDQSLKDFVESLLK